MTEANSHKCGLITEGDNNKNDYTFDRVISRILPSEIEDQTQSVKLYRALFAQDDDSPIWRRAMRLVPEDEWKSKRNRSNQDPYLLLPFSLIGDRVQAIESINSLQNKDLFLPPLVDLSDSFSPIRDQEGLPTCTAHAGVALMEYFQNRIDGYSAKAYEDAKKAYDSATEVDKEAKKAVYQDAQKAYKEVKKPRTLSWSFLYSVTRSLMKESESSTAEQSLTTHGLSLRSMLRAMALFGVPPEKALRWDEGKLSTEEKKVLESLKKGEQYESNNNPLEKNPSAYSFAYAQNYQAAYYFKLNRPNRNLNTKKGTTERELKVMQIRIALASGFPAIFGIDDMDQVYFDKDKATNNAESTIVELDDEVDDGDGHDQKVGHALIAVGYDDNIKFPRKSSHKNDSGSELHAGAFKVRNSWGKGWGDNGYGWIPYDYVANGSAKDWWSLVAAEWIDFGGLGLESSDNGYLSLLQCVCPMPCAPRC